MAADNALVTPMVFSIPRTARNHAQDAYQIAPQPIPVSITKIMGEHVKVKVEAKGRGVPYTLPDFVVPQGYSEWIRPPTQVGDKGWLVEANYYLGGMSGLNGGTAQYYGRANLTPMVFVPISQKQFPHNSDRDLDACFFNGPKGVIAQDRDGKYIVAAYDSPKALHGKNGVVASNDGNVYVGPRPPTSKVVYLGAEVDSGGGLVGTYDWVMTAGGPSINVKARTG